MTQIKSVRPKPGSDEAQQMLLARLRKEGKLKVVRVNTFSPDVPRYLKKLDESDRKMAANFENYWVD